MEHKSYEELANVVHLYDSGLPTQVMPREERLQRWVSLLKQQADRTLTTLNQTEDWPIQVRDAMRADNSAITVAFEDRTLRAAGLLGDTYGDAKRFFGLSDWQLHSVVCYCHHGVTIPAGVAARQVQTFIPKARGAGIFRRALRAVGFGN